MAFQFVDRDTLRIFYVSNDRMIRSLLAKVGDDMLFLQWLDAGPFGRLCPQGY